MDRTGRAKHSNTAVVLLQMFAAGELSGRQIQMVAAAIEADGMTTTCELLPKFARAGLHGVYSGNVLRDVLNACRSVGLMASVCKPYVFRAGLNNHIVEMFLPHELLTMLKLNHGHIEKMCMDAGELAASDGLGSLLRTWADEVGFDGDVSECPVVGMHCDGVNYGSSLRAGQQKSVVCASMNVISSKVPELRHHRHPLYVVHKDNICKCGCNGYHTYQDINAVIAWSMACLKEGVTPRARHDGSAFNRYDLENRLCGGFETPRCALLQVRGDWAWIMEAFRFRSPSSDSFCWLCPAAKSILSLCRLRF